MDEGTIFLIILLKHYKHVLHIFRVHSFVRLSVIRDNISISVHRSSLCVREDEAAVGMSISREVSSIVPLASFVFVLRLCVCICVYIERA